MKPHVLNMALIALMMTGTTTGRTMEQFTLFTGKGNRTTYEKLIERTSSREVILFGEEHGNSVAHWLERRLLKDLYSRNQKIALGLEMLETDNQVILDEYLQGHIAERSYLKSMRLWTRYKNRYHPLVAFAQRHGLSVYATNVPRRYASMVSRKGFSALDKLDASSKQFFPPLPIPYDPSLPLYRDITKIIPGHAHGFHSDRNIAAAQALKDASMAWHIIKGLETSDHFFHVHGSYHSLNRSGIAWYLEKYRPGTTYLTIAVITQDTIESLDSGNQEKADFIVLTSKDVLVLD